MHWIQTIREVLQLSREELAQYLQISSHTIVSVENNRRPLPIDSLLPAITLYNVIKDCNKQAGFTKPRLTETIPRPYDKKTIHGQRFRRLDKYSRKFKKIQEGHTRARLRLNAYQSLVQQLANGKYDRARLQWVQWKIREAKQAIQENTTTTQHLLAAEIAGMKSMMRALQEISG